MKLQWRADPQDEAMMRSLEIKWEVRTIKIDEIDWHASENNAARLRNPLISELIEDYMMGMENGDTFPMPVLERLKSGLYVILSGNQRCNAVRRLHEANGSAGTSLDAYIVETKDRYVLDAFLRAANSRHGGRSDKDERFAHAVFCVTKNGMTVADAARLFNVSSSSINLKIKADEERQWLSQKGIEAALLPQSALAAISGVSDPLAKVELARTVVRHSPTADEIKQVSLAVQKAKSASAKRRTIAQFESDLQQSSRPTSASRAQLRRPYAEKFLRPLESLVAHAEHGNGGEPFRSLSEMQFTETHAVKIKSLWNRLKLVMDELTK